MTKLLASVRTVSEARAALENGADIIDLKEPHDGALGAVSPDVLDQVRDALGPDTPISAVAGNLPMEPGMVVRAVLERRAADYVKIGFFPAAEGVWENICRALAEEAAGYRKIAVLFADDGVDLAVLDLLRHCGFAGVMLDTRNKDGRRLLDHLSVRALADFVEAARQRQLFTGLAGALEAPDIPRLLPLQPDYLGFRTALTAGGRGDDLSGAAVRRIARLVQGGGRPPHGARLDRIFIRDFVQEMQIGAYGFERGRVQRVSFSIEAEVYQPDGGAQDMADVYSYDLMMDAVRGLVERGHTDLVETLAEELAAAILSDARVASVMVRVEKLDLGPRAAGIEIRRGKTGAPERS